MKLTLARPSEKGNNVVSGSISPKFINSWQKVAGAQSLAKIIAI